MRNEIRKGPGTRLKSEGRTQGRLVASLGVVLALPAGLACSGDDASDAMETGTARIALTQAPSGVGCVAITAQGVRTLTRSFDLTTGKSTDVEMAGLPTGVVNFTGNAFDTACNRVPASASATWISDVTTAVIGPGAVADVALLMRRNGRADVGVDWTADPPQPTVYEPFGYISGETALGESGGIGFSAPWSAGGFNASLHDNFVIASGSLAYPGLAVSGGHVSSSAQTSLSGLSRPLAHPIGQTGTATEYLSFLIQPEGVLDDGLFSGFFGLTLGSTQAELFVGKPGGQTDDYVMEDRGGGGQVPSTTATVVGQAALLVVKIEVTPTLDRLTLYVNPHVGAPEPATGIVKEDPILNEFDSVLLYSTGAFSLDEIRIGDTFASVTPGAS